MNSYKKVSSLALDWIGLSLFIKARIVLTPGGSSTLGEVNLVAFYTTSPNNRRLVSSTLCTHAVPRPICAGGLQSLLFRHDFAFVVLYLSLLFMGHKDTIGPRRCSGKTQAHRDKFVGNREISNCEVNEVRWMILKRSRNITVHVLIAESKVLTLIGVGTFCATIHQRLLVTADIPKYNTHTHIQQLNISLHFSSLHTLTSIVN